MDDDNEIIFFDVGWLDTVVVVGLTCFILCECIRTNLRTIPVIPNQDEKETREWSISYFLFDPYEFIIYLNIFNLALVLVSDFLFLYLDMAYRCVTSIPYSVLHYAYILV